MTPPELRARLAALGLTHADTARMTGRSVSAVKRWLNGTHPIPDDMVETVEAWEDFTDGVIERELLRGPGPRTLTVYRTDDAMHAAHPEWSRFPASWWLMTAHSIVAEIGGTLTYDERIDP